MTCTCKQCDIHTNKTVPQTIQASLRTDPTRTLTIRRQFEAEMVKRFNVIKQSIILAIVDRDIFRLKQPTTNALVPDLNIMPFEFATDAKKIDGFMAWLGEMESKNILTTETKPSMYGSTNQPWSNTYIQSAYQRGMSRARAELRKAGYDAPSAFGQDLTGKSPVAVAFNQPFSADRVAVIYTRAYNELKGITNAMDQQISRVLAQGLTEGRNPRDIANMIVDRVDKIGLTRARMLARTEVINAHHQATINEYEQWGVLGVSVEAEWVTAGFNVCPYCAGNAGKTFTLAQIRGMIPAHPNCRCVAIPISKKMQEAQAKKALDDFMAFDPSKDEPLDFKPPKKVVTLPVFKAPIAPQAIPPIAPAEVAMDEISEIDKIFENKYNAGSTLAGEKKAAIAKRLYNDLKDDPDFIAYLKAPERDFDGWGGGTYESFSPAIQKEFGENEIRKFIRLWAGTSGDNNAKSIVMQLAAKEEFGLKDALLSHLPINKMGYEGTQERIDALMPNMPVYRKFLRKQYEWTQEFLKENNITEIKLVRGMSYPEATFNVSGEYTVQLQPMSSYSTDRFTAGYFADEESADRAVERILMTETVPAKNIIGTTKTGYGCTEECEFVVFGGKHTAQLEVQNTRFKLQNPHK